MFVLVIILIVGMQQLLGSDFDRGMRYFNDQPGILWLIFAISELCFGIFPPELFMYTVASGMALWPYAVCITGMSLLSLLAGWLNFRLGKILYRREFFPGILRRQIQAYRQKFDRYGGFLVLVAAVTPLPFALISMISGIMGLSEPLYWRYAAFRIVRFVVYGAMVWEVAGN